MLDKYTALRFEDVDVPRAAIVKSAAISFVPYVPGDERNPSQTDYCSDTNDLGGHAHQDGISPTAISPAQDYVTLATTVDLRGVAAGQRMRLGDAAGQVCLAAPKNTDLVPARNTIVSFLIHSMH